MNSAAARFTVMRLIVLAPLVLLASLVPDPGSKPGTDQEDRHGFQLTDHELQTACAIMDESLRDTWHTFYEATAASWQQARNIPYPVETPPPPVVSDEVFLRRATLDATDVIPTAEEVESFLADPAPDKRDRLVDRLLQSPGHTQRQFNRFAEMMRLRDEIGGLPQDGYIALVRSAAEKNVPYDQFVHTLLTASGNVKDNPATGFLLRDQGDLLQTTDELTWDFLQADLHCTICHDHPFNEFTEDQFYDLASCFGATQVQLRRSPNDPAPKEVWPRDAYTATRSYSLSREGILTIHDVPQFGLRLPTNWEYRLRKPNELLTKASSLPFINSPSVVWRHPKDVREHFAQWLISNDRFAQAAALREWTSLFGAPRTVRGRFVEDVASLLPVSASASPNVHAVHCDNNGAWTELNDIDRLPPDRTELKFINALAALMRHVHFDLREFQRVLMHTRAYAHIATPDAPLGGTRFSVPPAPFLRRLSAEQIWNSMVLLGGTDGAEWRPASELPQSLPDAHSLRTLGRGPRLRSDDSSSPISGALARLMMNSTTVQHATNAPSSIIARAENQWKNSPADQVDFIFRAVLGRSPVSDQERSHAIEVVSQPNGLRDLTWALLNTSEFLFQK